MLIYELFCYICYNMKSKLIRVKFDLLEQVLEATKKENRSPRNAVDTLLKEALENRKLKQNI